METWDRGGVSDWVNEWEETGDAGRKRIIVALGREPHLRTVTADAYKFQVN